MERNGGKKQLKIKNNPGISVNINQERFSNNILINLSNITNVIYIEIVKIYINFLLIE